MTSFGAGVPMQSQSPLPTTSRPRDVDAHRVDAVLAAKVIDEKCHV